MYHPGHAPCLFFSDFTFKLNRLTYKIEKAAVLNGHSFIGNFGVEVMGVAGYLCNKQMRTVHADVYCKSIGFPIGRRNRAHANTVQKGPPWIPDIMCTGNESSIFDCPRSDVFVDAADDCSDNENSGDGFVCYQTNGIVDNLTFPSLCIYMLFHGTDL